MTFSHEVLRSVPLFADIPDDHLARLVASLSPLRLAAGDVVFRAGDLDDRFLLLVEGEVEVQQDRERIAVPAVAPVGELGALAGLRRNTTAVARVASTLLAVPAPRLFAFFQENGDIGFRFHDRLTHILADKIDRDRRLVDEMRAHIIETQKAMKRMREALLDSEDTALHRVMFEELDAHIENNRRGRYLVAVPRALPLHLRLDGDHPVQRISNERIFVRPAPGFALAPGAVFAGVLVARDAEIALSGTVDGPAEDGTVSLSLDALVEESSQQLEKLLARVQLLDVVL